MSEHTYYPAWTREVVADGARHTLTAQIAPYSLSAPPLVVDVGIAQERGFPVTAKRVTLDIDPATLVTTADVVAALDRAFTLGAPWRFVTCSRDGCTRQRLDVGHDTNRFAQVATAPGTGDHGGDRRSDYTQPLCETCFADDLEREWEAEEAKSQLALARDEQRMYARGFRWAVDGWVHPKGGGDDYCVTLYFPTKPTAREITASLARTSRVTNDHSAPRALTAATGGTR